MSTIHASTTYVDNKVADEAASRAAADDSITAAVQGFDTKLTSHANNGSAHVTDEDRARWNSKAPLENGKIPASVLPSFVDDVLEYDTFESLPDEGEGGKIYVTKDTNKQYRWSGSDYVVISESLALGETDSTAYPGSKGAANAAAIAAEESRASSAEAAIRQLVSEFVKNIQADVTGTQITITFNSGESFTFPSSQMLPATDPEAFGSFGIGLKDGSTKGGIFVDGLRAGTGECVINLDNTENSSTKGCVIKATSGKLNSDGTVKGPSIEVGKAGKEAASIKKNGVEVATEDQIPYPIAAAFMVDDDVYQLSDRTVNTFDASGSFVFPEKVGTAARDFVIVITAGSEAPSVSFPATGVTYVGEGADAFAAEANKVNIWWFSEVGDNVFSVNHKAFSTIEQGAS